MINNKLKVGDYVFTTDGKLFRITKINKLTYSARETVGWTVQVPFNGIGSGIYGEFFECDEPQKKALELAIKAHDRNTRTIRETERAKELIGKAKYFLRHVEDFLDGIEDIEEIEPTVDFK